MKLRELRWGLLPAISLTICPVWAHVVMKDFEARAGYQEFLTLVVPHGCGPEATTRVRVKMPEGTTIAVPEPKVGWQLDIKMRKLDEPMPFEGGRVLSEVVDEFSWSGSLPSAHLGRFTFLVRLPDEPGKVVYFKTIQECGDIRDSWVETVAAGEETWRLWLLEKPSPFIELVQPSKPQLGVTSEELRRAREAAN